MNYIAELKLRRSNLIDRKLDLESKITDLSTSISRLRSMSIQVNHKELKAKYEGQLLMVQDSINYLNELLKGGTDE